MGRGTRDQKTSLPNMVLRESKGEAISLAGIVTAGADASSENPSVSRNFSMEGGRISQILYLIGIGNVLLHVCLPGPRQSFFIPITVIFG